MDIVLIFNGLGNQMSQYALYLAKKKRSSRVYCFYFPSTHDDQHNGFELDKVFKIKISKSINYYFLYFLYTLYLKKYQLGRFGKFIVKLLKYLKVNVIYEDFSTYNFDSNNLLKGSGLTYYYGGWHNEKYFKEIEKEIIKTFSFNNDKNDKKINHLKNEIQNKTSVSIHIRRGDYLKKSQFGNICSWDYYNKAIDYMYRNVETPFFYIFSDDKSWVKENFDIPNSYIVDCNVGKESWKDMYLMSICKYNINANSTFSWWAAWLNKNPNKIVIAPSKFNSQSEMRELYPESWIKIGV